jgi:hypothetical protein
MSRSQRKKKVAVPASEVPQASLPEPLFVDIREAGRRLGFTTWAMRTLCWAKKIRFVKQRRKYLFSPADLRNYAQRLLAESESAAL